MLPGVIEREAGVIEITLLAQPGEGATDHLLVFRSAAEIGAHFMNGMGAAHQRAKSGGIKLLLGGNFSRR